MLLQSIKVWPHPTLKHQIRHSSRKLLNSALLFLLLYLIPTPHPLRLSLCSHMDAFHLFLSGGQRHPCMYLHSGCPLANERRLSLFPNCAFCTFNRVSLSRADYRRLSSLKKVRAGIGASWGIRGSNWFQLYLFFCLMTTSLAVPMDAVVHMFEGGPFFFRSSAFLASRRTAPT